MIVIIISYNVFKVVSAFFDELQAVNHTSIVSECILLALDGLEFTSIQLAAAICIVPSIFIIIIFVLVQHFSCYYFEPALAYTRTILNRVEVSPCLGVLSVVSCTIPSFRSGCYINRSLCSLFGLRSDLLITFIQRPLSYHSAVLIKCVLLTIDSFIFGSFAVISLDHLTIRFEVEPTCLIFIIVKCSCGILIIIIGSFVICNIC